MKTREKRQAPQSRISILITFAVIVIAMVSAESIHAQTGVSHLVQVGDTWAALAYQYGLPSETLWHANGILNTGREPIIGSTVAIPIEQTTAADSVREHGLAIRPNHQSRLLTALAYNTTPFELDRLNHTEQAPFLHLDLALFVDDAGSLPRDLPPSFATLELSHNPAVPGQGMAFRGTVAQPVAVSATLDAAALDALPFDTLLEFPYVVGVRGTGAFYPAGAHEFTVHVDGHAPWSQPWLMIPGEWLYEEVNYTGAAAEIDADAIATERARLFAIWEAATPGVMWSAEFREPIDDYLVVSSLFGTRRSVNGGPYNRYHEGVDFAAYGGTPVYAAADGVVVVAEPLYVRGGAVIIDHGLGIYSGTYHLSQVSAEKGQIVHAGDKIGEVGTTGLSTGNHLHWDFLVTETWVDASKWREQRMGCWVLEGLGRPCATDNSVENS
ncbi:MAG: LysM peptidoglycan-binding domain-containing M23 family metallopeptidase [Anaerolineae bacterium]|nr:LysM peptidoglycan-binding domain-containing M23 family metallopeptidase [Anaerolineae bacterium]MCO5192239.1 LysM peptidoglycan-binding domain-containing M23 family metallopeptidase [Anaerolineae bacterium]